MAMDSRTVPYADALEAPVTGLFRRQGTNYPLYPVTRVTMRELELDETHYSFADLWSGWEHAETPKGPWRVYGKPASPPVPDDPAEAPHGEPPRRLTLRSIESHVLEDRMKVAFLDWLGTYRFVCEEGASNEIAAFVAAIGPKIRRADQP